MTSPFKRSRLVVDPAVQFRMLGRLGIYLLIYTVTLLHVGFAIEVFEKVVMADHGPLVGALYVEYMIQHKSLFIAMAMILPVLLYDLLKFSHRIVGPLFRCRRWMLDMAAGKVVEEFVPRKKDLMNELFQAFNELIHTCNARVESVNGAPKSSMPVAESTSVSLEQHVGV